MCLNPVMFSGGVKSSSSLRDCSDCLHDLFLVCAVFQDRLFKYTGQFLDSGLCYFCAIIWSSLKNIENVQIHVFFTFALLIQFHLFINSFIY